LTVDALVFEFMGLAMLALCVIVLVVPSTRRPTGRQVRDFWRFEPTHRADLAWSRPPMRAAAGRRHL